MTNSSKATTAFTIPRVRMKARWRTRRVIFNDDGDDVWMAKQPTPEGYLATRIAPAMDTQVDSVFLCTTEDIGYYLHRSKFAQLFTRDHSGIPISKDVMLVKALEKQGTDVLQVGVDSVHRSGKEIIWSHRMNGMEDMVVDWLLGDFKAKHPEWWLGGPDFETRYPAGDHRHWYKVLDYAVPEVRAYVLDVIREVIDNYDIDGVELDYLRDPWLFKETFTDPVRPVTADHCRMMVEFHNKVRAMLDAKSRRVGRPLLLALRVPAWPYISKYLGLDIERTLKTGSVDILIGGGGYTPFHIPPTELLKLAHKYKVPAYVCISASGMKTAQPGSRRAELLAWRGAALNLWDAGADGQYVFNTMPDGPTPNFAIDIMREIGDPNAMRKKETLFALDTWTPLAGAGYCNLAIKRTGLLPLAIDSATGRAACQFYVGIDPLRTPTSTAVLRAWFDGLNSPQSVSVALNGKRLDPSSGVDAKSPYVEYQVAPRDLRHRVNELTLATNEMPGAQVTLKHFELIVTPASN